MPTVWLRPRRLLATVVVTALAATGLGVAVPTSAFAADGATTVQVPALWAGTDAQGKPVQGIERATVTTRKTPRPVFEVDLASVKAEGAGPQWVAASALAATVAMLYAGNDPRVYGANYTITGPIDGPSAGAILTIGTLAALKGDRLDKKVTMTGTIAPDGTVGVVGLVLQKLRAAKKAGFRTVMIPYGTERQYDGTKEVNAVNYGAELGLEVIVVHDIVEAYEQFTGHSLVPPVREEPALEPAVVRVTEATTRALADRIDVAMATLPGGVPTETLTTLAAQVAEVRAAIAAADFPTAYGLGVDTYQNVGRAAAAATTQSALAAGGSAAVRTALAADAARLLAAAQAALTAGSDITGLGLDQQLALPIALGWVTFAIGTLEYEQTVLADPATTADGLLATAGALADQRAAIEVFGPDALATVRAETPQKAPAAGKVASFLSGYSTFLRTSADANVKYAQALAGPEFAKANPTVAGTLLAMQQGNAVIDAKVQTLPDEIAQASRAMSYFALAEMLVSGRSFGLVGFGVGEDARLTRSDAVLLDSSVWGGGELTQRSLSESARDGDVSDYGLWQTEWGLALYDALDQTPRVGAAGAIALGEIWYALIGTRIDLAAKEALGRT